MIFAEITVTLLGGAVLAVALALISAGAAFLSYRSTVPPLPGGRRLFLTALRALTLLALVLMLCEPVLRIVDRTEEPPRVAVLLDDTESIPVSGAEAGRTVAEFLESARSAEMPGADLSWYSFSGSVTPLGERPPDSLAFAGQTTSLSAALGEMASRMREENVRAVVLMSDGHYNEGRNPLNELGDLGIPVFTVGVGDTARQKDLLIDRVYTNALAYAGAGVPAEVYLRSFGYDGDRVEISVREGSEVLDRTSVLLEGGRTEYALRLTIPARTEGTHRYTVTVDALPGEVTSRNNEQNVFIRVLRSRIRVVMFAGSPFPDVASLGQVVREDPQLELRSFVQKSRGAFIGGRPDRATIDSADCFMFVGFPSPLTPDDVLGEIAGAMAARRTPLFYVHGKSVDYAKLKRIDAVLPFTVSSPNPMEDPVFASVPAAMKDHPLVINQTGELTASAWENLPPVFKVRTAFSPKAGAEVLATARLQNFPLPEPLVLTRNAGGMKSLAVTGHGIYRWRLMAQGSSATDRFLTSFVPNVLRWLTTREDERPVRVSPLKEIFTTAEGAGFRAEVYNDQLLPVDDAEVTVEISDGGRKQALGLQPLGNGRYEGSFGPLPAAEYTFTATAGAGGRALGRDAGRFTVGQVNVEYLTTSMDADLLARIAGQSGGEFFPPEDGKGVWAAVARQADLSPKENVQRREIQLWNWGYLGAAILVLLAVEWFLRKRWALL